MFIFIQKLILIHTGMETYRDRMCQLGVVVVVIIMQLDLQRPKQSVQITGKIAYSDPAHGEVY
jgi:hypothetical protein